MKFGDGFLSPLLLKPCLCEWGYFSLALGSQAEPVCLVAWLPYNVLGWWKCSTFSSLLASLVFFSNAGLIIVNAWYGKFVNDQSRKNEKVKVIDVTVPLQCLVKDSKLILTETSKVGTQPCPVFFLTAI